MRCYDERQFKNAALKHLTKSLGGNEEAAKRLCDYVYDLMKATGNRVMGYGEDCDYDDDLFYDCSTDYQKCLKQIASVPKPRVKEQPKPTA